MTDPFWISFSVTPVQRFVEAARSVRDLASGSAILSSLVRSAVAAGEAVGARRYYPIAPAADSTGVPNKSILTAGEESVANDARVAMRNAAVDSWKQLSSKVHDALERDWRPKLGSGVAWDRGWEDQLWSYFEIVALGLDFRRGPSEARGRWVQTARALQLAKQVRRFPEDQGIGRPKCMMLGELEQMGPGGSLQEQADFWEAVRNTRIGAILLDRKGREEGRSLERLCAVSLVKRFAPAVATDEILSALGRDEIPDTREVARGGWRRRASTERADAWKSFRDSASRLAHDRGLDEPDVESWLERAPAPLDQELPTEAEKGLLAARTQLVGALGAPPRYFAVLVADVDELGRHLGGEFLVGEWPHDFHRETSRALSAFAANGVPEIVRSHDGFLVYAGGDDVLALLPAEQALPCARALREKLPAIPGEEDGSLTLSAGVAVVHTQYDLADALSRARSALGQAKAWERDALGLSAVRRAGNAVQVVLPWEAASTTHALAELFQAGVSNRWVAAFAELVPALHPLLPHESHLVLLESVLRRMQGGKTADRAEAKQKARELLRRLFEDRTRRTAARIGREAETEGAYAGVALAAAQDFVVAAQTAEFLVRGGE